MAGVALVTAPREAPVHETGPHHPEKAERVDWILAHLERTGLLADLFRIESFPIATHWIETIHDPAYVRRVRETCARGDVVIDSMDTEIGRDSYEAALHAAGAAAALCDAVVRGEVASGFSALRPPGHHAERALAMGFCLFNNVAIAARYLQQRHGLQRILIVDWDVHHGNGTQNAFEEDPDVFYFSTHQFPHYPGTGSSAETGRGKGKGATRNVPMRAGSGDEEYRRAFRDVLVPAAAAHRPEAILVSAGFDAHEQDPLADIRLSDAFYGEMTEILRHIAREQDALGPISLLEGGYHPEAMPRAVEAHLRALMAAA